MSNGPRYQGIMNWPVICFSSSLRLGYIPYNNAWCFQAIHSVIISIVLGTVLNFFPFFQILLKKHLAYVECNFSHWKFFKYLSTQQPSSHIESFDLCFSLHAPNNCTHSNLALKWVKRSSRQHSTTTTIYTKGWLPSWNNLNLNPHNLRNSQ